METIAIYLHTFFEWLMRTSLQASLLICLILLVQKILKGRLGVRWHYGLWLLLLVRMALPWSIQSQLSIYSLIPQKMTSQHLTDITQSTNNSDTSSDAVFNSLVTSTQADASPAGQLNETETKSVLDSINVQNSQGQIKNPQVSDPENSWFVLRSIEIVNILSITWLAGAIVLAIHICLNNLNLWRIVKQQHPLTNQKILDLLEECKDQMAVQTILGIVPTDKVKSPALFGFLRPRLLLPQVMLDDLSLPELRYVLLHELAHLKRHDIYIGWLMSILQILHWFNPLVWLAFYRMRTDRELVCDALVLTRTQSGRAKDYGSVIVGLVERFSQTRRLSAMAGIMENKAQLKRRITMIAKFNKNSYRWSPLAVILIIFIGCFSLPNNVSVDTEDTKPVISLHEAVKEGDTKQVKLLISQRADINAENDEGYTPLGIAVDNNNLKIAEILVSNGADVNGEWNFGISYLHYATIYNNEKLVKFLIDKGVDVNAKIGGKGRTSLELAKLNGFSNIARLLHEHGAKHYLPSEEDDAEPLLHEAAVDGDIEQIQSLISKGADVNAMVSGETPMISAIYKRGHKDVVELLIAEGANVNARTDSGMTPLLCASAGGYADIAKLLIDNGADVNVKKTPHGTTPLWLASQSGRTEVVKLLLDNNADVNMRDSMVRVSPLWIASQKGRTDVVKILLNNNADVEIKDSVVGVTALWIASQNGHKEIVKLLLDSGADVNVKYSNYGGIDKWLESQNGYTRTARLMLDEEIDLNLNDTNIGRTSLIMAAQNGYTDIVKLLLDNGANTNIQTTRQGFNALILASYKGYSKIVKLLLDSGADVNVKSNEGETPLGLAIQRGHKEIIELLREYGAKE